MDVLLQQFFNLEIMGKALPLVLQGLRTTLLICAIVIPMGLLGGVLVALASRSSLRALRVCVTLLVDLMRALPPLVVLILVYSGLPFLGLRISPLTAVPICGRELSRNRSKSDSSGIS